MTKAEIVQALYTRVGGFSKKESADIVDLVFEMMKETLGRGEKIKISGFGNFVLRDKRQRPGRNPQTGDPIKISERRVLTFKASQILKHALNAAAKDKNGGGVPTHGSPASAGSAGAAGAPGAIGGAGIGSAGVNTIHGSSGAGTGSALGSSGLSAGASGLGAQPLAAAASEAPKE